MIATILLLILVIATPSLLFHVPLAEKLTCFCTTGSTNCDRNNSCVAEGVCLAYYRETTLIQFCGRTFQSLICQANDGIHLGTNAVCCYENYCNTKETVDNIYGTLMPSNESLTPTSTQRTVSTIPTVQTTSTIMISTTTSVSTTSLSTQTTSASLTEKQSSGPQAYAIALSVILPLIILAIFGIAIVMFLMYVRLYIKHNKEKPSTQFMHL